VHKGCDNLNQELLTKALTKLGLTETDAEIYLLLAKEGPQQGRSIARTLELYKQQLYRSLKRLQKKGVVYAILERPARFSAVSLEKVLDFLIEAKKEQALALQESREELLAGWRAVTKKESTDT
jgi:sugar-specific transcriptional regulator TrmB